MIHSHLPRIATHGPPPLPMFCQKQPMARTIPGTSRRLPAASGLTRPIHGLTRPPPTATVAAIHGPAMATATHRPKSTISRYLRAIEQRPRPSTTPSAISFPTTLTNKPRLLLTRGVRVTRVTSPRRQLSTRLVCQRRSPPPSRLCPCPTRRRWSHAKRRRVFLAKTRL